MNALNVIHIDFHARETDRSHSITDAPAEAELIVFVPRAPLARPVSADAAAAKARRWPGAPKASGSVHDGIEVLNDSVGRMVSSYAHLGNESVKLQESISRMRAQSQRMTAAINQMTSGLRQFQQWMEAQAQ